MPLPKSEYTLEGKFTAMPWIPISRMIAPCAACVMSPPFSPTPAPGNLRIAGYFPSFAGIVRIPYILVPPMLRYEMWYTFTSFVHLSGRSSIVGLRSTFLSFSRLPPQKSMKSLGSFTVGCSFSGENPTVLVVEYFFPSWVMVALILR